MRPLTMEYIAGFVDGEGSFVIAITPRNHYFPFFCISNTNRQILVDIQKYFHVRLKFRSIKRKDPKRKIVYELRTSNIYGAKSIARQLLPFLRIKYSQAEIIIQYPEGEGIPIGKGFKGDYSIKSLQRKLYIKMRALNKRGPGNEELSGDPEEEYDPQLGLFKNNK